jgi:hypothetical protein
MKQENVALSFQRLYLNGGVHGEVPRSASKFRDGTHDPGEYLPAAATA